MAAHSLSSSGNGLNPTENTAKGAGTQRPTLPMPSSLPQSQKRADRSFPSHGKDSHLGLLRGQRLSELTVLLS